MEDSFLFLIFQNNAQLSFQLRVIKKFSKFHCRLKRCSLSLKPNLNQSLNGSAKVNPLKRCVQHWILFSAGIRNHCGQLSVNSQSMSSKTATWTFPRLFELITARLICHLVVTEATICRTANANTAAACCQVPLGKKPTKVSINT